MPTAEEGVKGATWTGAPQASMMVTRRSGISSITKPAAVAQGWCVWITAPTSGMCRKIYASAAESEEGFRLPSIVRHSPSMRHTSSGTISS